MAVQDYKINYKSDFVLTINGDAGWAVPFCIKFWTGMPSQAYFVGFDGVKYVNCRVGDTPTQLLVMFDDHHLPIGKLKMQIAYHTTIEEFPGSVFDEVTNARDVIVTIDGTDYQVMLDFTGEDAPELEFDLPAYANEAERIQNELQRQQNEADRIAAELQREQATAAAVQGAENVNAQIAGNILTVTNRQGVSTSVNTKGEQGEQGPVGPEGPQGQTGVSITGLVKTGETETDTLYNVTFSDGTTQAVAIPKGERGERGPVGPEGPQGQTGVSITGLVKTGETETDTLYNVTFSNGTTQQVSIPKGEKGDQGEQGPEGPQGPMGDVAVITPEQQAAFTMYSTTGQNTDGPMTQKAVTDAISIIMALNIKWQQTSLGTDYLPTGTFNKTRNAVLINVFGFDRITLDGSADEIYVNCYLLDSSYNLITSYDNPWALSRDISIGNAVYMSMTCKKGSAGTATLNVGDNTLVVTGYKSAKEKITEFDGYIQQLGSECENIEGTTVELTGAIGTWNGSTGSIGTRASTRAHLRISACNVNKMKIVIPTLYYASFFYVDANNISQGQVGEDMGNGTQELELSGEYDLMATIKYLGDGTTTITATMLSAAPFHVTTYGMNGYDPAAPYSELVEIKEQAFARIANAIELDSLDIQMLTYNGSGYGSSTTRAAGVLSNNFGKNAVINAAFTSGKMMFHFWNAAEEGATIYSLNTTTDTYIGETGWTGTGEVTQVPEECNVVVCLFDATSVSQARGILTSAIITSGVPISNRVSDLEKDVKAISNNAVYNIFKKYRNLTIPQDAQTEIVVMENGDKITHDATHIVKDGKAYVVYCANQHDTGDSGEFSNYAVVRLDIYDVSNGIANATLQSRQTIGGNGYAVGGSTISGGAGVPNAYLVGNIIHIIFGAKIGSTWTEIHCTYDTSTSTLGSLEQCTMDSSPLTGSVLATHSSLASSFNYQLSFNASIAEIVVGGTTYYYACICSAARIANGLIVRTTNFKDWEFVTEPSFTGSGAQYEGAMGAYDGYLYLALRQNVSGTVPNGMLLAKLETDGSVVEYKYMTACNSRPAFYNQDGLLYLIVPSGTRSTATFYRVNGSVNDLKEIAEITGDTDTFGQYLEVVPTSPQYVTYTTANGYSYSYVRLFVSDVIAGDEDVLGIMLSKLN